MNLLFLAQLDFPRRLSIFLFNVLHSREVSYQSSLTRKPSTMNSQLLSSLIIFQLFSIFHTRTICVRPNHPDYEYVLNSEGNNIANTLDRIANINTRNFILNYLPENGHSSFECEQRKMNSVVKDYQNCLFQIMHQLKCGPHVRS